MCFILFHLLFNRCYFFPLDFTEPNIYVSTLYFIYILSYRLCDSYGLILQLVSVLAIIGQRF